MSRPIGNPDHAEPRWHRRKEERPAEILEAALAEFVSRGYSAARLEDIARRAGCTKGTIFLYFPTKEELFKGVVRSYVIPRLEEVERMVDEHRGSARELLEKVLRARWGYMQDDRVSGLPKLIYSEAGNFPDLVRFFHDELQTRSQGVIARVLRMGIESGEFRPLDVPNVALAAITPIVMAALWRQTFKACGRTDPGTQAYFESVIDLLLRGVSREAASQGEA